MRARTMTKVLALAGLALGVTLSAGCKSRFADICKSISECSGGNEADIKACEVSYDTDADVAAAYDCSDPYDKLADCYEASGKCQGGGYRVDCTSEAASLASCKNAASARGKGSSSGDTGSGSTTGGSGASSGGAGGPGGQCGSLSSLCAGCANATYREQCQNLANAANEQACKTALDGNYFDPNGQYCTATGGG